MSFKGMARVLIISVLPLVYFGLHCRSSACPPSCSCPGPSVLNCSLAGLRAMPQIRDSVAHLDVSHNRLERATLVRRTLPQLRTLHLANNSVARLSLCIHGRVQGQGCASWAPNLQLLSAERNQLRRLPRGLSALKVLEVLQLSDNRISAIQPGELDNLRGLRELHLKHNLISSLHPHALQHLLHLKVLDVSFNTLASLNPSMYFSLRTIGADLHLAGNRWRCDCSMRSIRRWMAFDRGRGSHSWDLVCASPPVLAGADLLQLEDGDLNCWSAENEPQLHQDVTVYRGSEVLLSCTTEGAFWWTPSGSVPANRPQSGLLVSDITEKNAGLYACLSKGHQVVSVFHLRIEGTNRKARSVLERIAGEERSQNVTQSDLTLAVCLSVFITFLVAFILGVLLRPCIDILWKKIRKKTPDSALSAGERQYDNEAYSEGEDPDELRPRYDNEAYSEGEDPEQLRPHRERRVTFSTVDFREENDVKYYDTERETEPYNAVVERESVRDSGCEKSLEDRKDLSDRNFKRRSFSDSSLSDKDQMEVNTVQQNSKDLPQISNCKSLQFSSEPFADWMPHPNNGGLLAAEPEDNVEQFDFSDSVRSTSPRTSSPVGSFNYTRQIMPRLNRKDSYSSSSYMSDDEPSQYTVNPEPQEDELVGRSYAKTEVSDSLASSKTARGSEPTVNQDAELWWPVVDLERSMRIQRRMDIKLLDSDGQKKSLREKRRKGKVITAGVRPLTSFSSTDSEGETRPPVTVPPTLDSKTNWPVLELEHNIPVHRRLDIQAPSLTSDSLSEDGSIHLTEAPQKVNREGLRGQEVHEETDTRWPSKEHQIPYIESQFDLKSKLADSSSGSDSEEVTGAIMTQPPSKVASSYDPQAPWPLLNLAESFRIKRCLDVRALSPTSHSTSSIDSEDETMYHTQKQEQGTIKVARDPIRVSPKLSYDPQSPWPSIDLEDSFRIKRSLHIKAPSPTSDSSSSSDGEDETMYNTEKQEQGTTTVTMYPIRAPPTPSYDPQAPWPSIDLEESFRIRRRLDVKAPSPTSDSSSSSDGEDEMTNHRTEQVQVITNVTRQPIRAPPTPSYDPQAPWPSIDLEDSFRIKRRLNVKAQSQTSDSSSDSEDETKYHMQKYKQGIAKLTKYPIEEPLTASYDPQAPWLSIDLEDYFRMKRRLDVKVQSQPSDSLSSSNSEPETTQGATKITNYPIKASPTPNYDPQSPWPSIELEDSFRIKRRLDFKALFLSPSSDNEDKRTNHFTKQEQETTKLTRYPNKAPPTLGYDPQCSPRLKRRLDTKAQSPHVRTSSGDSKVEAPSNVGSTTGAPWPSVELGRGTPVRRWLDIKAVPADVSRDVRQDRIVGVNLPSSSNEQADANADATETQALPQLHLGISRRLDVRTPSPQPAPDRVSPEARYSKSNSSTNDSEDENRDGNDSPKFAKKSSVKSPIISIPRSPKRNPDIKLEKYVVVPENVRDGTSSLTVEINPELQSRWANMQLGFSRFRKRLEITSHAPEPPKVPLSDSNMGAAKQKQPVVSWKGIRETESQLTVEQVHHKTEKSAVGPTSERTSSLPGGIPHIRRYLDVKAPPTQQRLDSSKSSENGAEPTDYTMWRRKSHDLGLSSPYASRTVETRQTTDKSQVTTVSGQSSSSNSEDEIGGVAESNEITEVAVGSVTTDSESPIQYRRSIIKASSVPNDTSTRDQHTTQRGSSYSSRYQNPSLAPKSIPNPRSGDDTSPTRDQHGSYYSVRYQNPSIPLKTIPNSGSGDDTPSTRDPSGVNIVTPQYGSSYSASYQNPHLASKTIPSPGSGDDTPPTGESSEVNIVTTESSSSYRGRYQNPFLARKTILNTGFGDEMPPTRDPSGVNIMTTQSGSSSSARYQILSLTPRPFRSSNEGLAAKMQWTGLRTPLSDLSKRPDASPLSPPKGLEKTTAGSFTPEVAQERGSTSVTRSLSPSGGSLSSLGTDETWKGASEKRDRRGLSALKAMSSQRQTWDREDEDVAFFPPSHIPGNFNLDRSELLISSTSASTAEDLLYNIPRYRTHEPLTQGIPPPDPTTPLPDEAVELTWNSKSSDSPSKH